MSEYVIIATMGGLIYNIIPLLELWKTPKESRPDFCDVFYWLPYFVWPLLAGFFLYLYEAPGQSLNKLLAFHIGLSTPLALRKMIEVLPVIPRQITLRDQDQ